MCHERERLIGYIYDECDPQERLRVETHLTGCATCREELGGLRQVRQDLLAWDVPEHGSVWRPFAPPRPRLSWRDVPAWALAAAAGVIFLAGAAGGVATRAWFPAASPAYAMTATASVPANSPAVAAAELAALETRVVNRVRAELASRPVQTSQVAVRSADEVQKLAESFEALENRYLDLLDVSSGMQNNIVRLLRASSLADGRTGVNERVSTVPVGLVR